MTTIIINLDNNAASALVDLIEEAIEAANENTAVAHSSIQHVPNHALAASHGAPLTAGEHAAAANAAANQAAAHAAAANVAAATGQPAIAAPTPSLSPGIAHSIGVASPPAPPAQPVFTAMVQPAAAAAIQPAPVQPAAPPAQPAPVQPAAPPAQPAIVQTAPALTPSGQPAGH